MPVTILAHSMFPAALGHWPVEPFTVTLLLASAVLYALGLHAVWMRAGRGKGVRAWQAVAFAAGLLSIAVALLSPLAWLSALLFSAHMAQHEILMLVSAPLLVFGHPLFVWLWALPPRTRDAVGAWTTRAAVRRCWRAATGPLAVFVVHGAALWIWHAPTLYDAALHDEGIHALQHASFLITAALFWWGMASGRYGRAGYGLAVVYVFLTAVHSSVLGALMTIAPDVWYADYARTAMEWQVSALEDQQLAGLLMWVPSGLVFIVFGLGLFAAWLGESDRRAALGSVAAAAAHATTGGASDAA